MAPSLTPTGPTDGSLDSSSTSVVIVIVIVIVIQNIKTRRTENMIACVTGKDGQIDGPPPKGEGGGEPPLKEEGGEREEGGGSHHPRGGGGRGEPPSHGEVEDIYCKVVSFTQEEGTAAMEMCEE